MAMDRDPNTLNRDSQVRDTQVYDRETRGSNTLAYLIGGLVIALGLLAFLFYDGGSRDVNTTGSTGTSQTQSAPSTGGPASAPATPTSPSAPAAPAAPANPQ
jgi:hypothetical protein